MAAMKNGHQDPAGHRLSLSEAKHLQAIEGNPLDAEQVAMFEMFDREGWSDERRRDYIRRRAVMRVGISAAE
jgi:hypothetical protein